MAVQLLRPREEDGGERGLNDLLRPRRVSGNRCELRSEGRRCSFESVQLSAGPCSLPLGPHPSTPAGGGRGALTPIRWPS